MARKRGNHLAAANRQRKLRRGNDSARIDDNAILEDQPKEDVHTADELNSTTKTDVRSDMLQVGDDIIESKRVGDETRFEKLETKPVLGENASIAETSETPKENPEPQKQETHDIDDDKLTGETNEVGIQEGDHSGEVTEMSETTGKPHDSTIGPETRKLERENSSEKKTEAEQMEMALEKDNEEEEVIELSDEAVPNQDTDPSKTFTDKTEQNVKDKNEFFKQVAVDESTGTTTFEFDGIQLKYKERSSVLEEKNGLIEFRVVNSDNSRENMMVLTGLKNIFQKQLPKMPKEYIARLVYDRSHLSMAIIKKPLTVVGGITYKPFNDRGFAEIVFCAVSSTEQVRGYGAHMMNHLKDYVKLTSPIKYFLTYADNYAIGYFKKQGFTKDVTLDRRLWMGYIKDYEGGTLMQCSMLPKIRYLDSGKILLLQEAAIRRKIRTMSKMHIVRPGLEHFKDLSNIVPLDPMTIPGIKESGWTPEMDELAQKPKRGPHYGPMQSILTELQSHNAAWPFLQAVNKNEVADYYEFIKEPMDLSTMETKLENNKYESFEDFIYDTRLIFKNCRAYNGENTSYFKYANKLEKFFNGKVKEYPEYADLIEN